MPGYRHLLPLIWDMSGGVCALCEKPLEPIATKVHIDHIVPRSRGGTNDAANLQAVHKSCNSRKRDRPMDEVVERIRTTDAKPSTLKAGQHMLAVSMSPDQVARLEDWRYSHRFGSRGDAIRFLLEAALDSDPIPEPRERPKTVRRTKARK